MSTVLAPHPGNAIAMHLSAYVPMTGLIGAVASWRIAVTEFDLVFAFIIGAIVGSCVSPLTYIAVRRRAAKPAYVCIFLPTLIVAGITSNPYNPAVSMMYAIAAYIISIALCMTLVPESRPVDECPRCSYSTKYLVSTRCPECGHYFTPEAACISGWRLRANLLRYAAAFGLLLTLFVLSVIGQLSIPDVSTASDSELIELLGHPDMQLQADATYELASRTRELVMNAISDDRPRVRRNAARSLGLRPGPWADEMLHEMLKDDSPRVRDEAAKWIYRRRHGDSLPPKE